MSKTKTVKVKVSEKLYRIVMQKLPWLSYGSMEELVSEAVAQRFEKLLILAARAS